MNRLPPAIKRRRGFTLVELVIVIALTGIVAVLASTMVGQQMLGYADMTRRAALMGKADNALQVLARELRKAVPYSIRVNGGTAIEWVPAQTWGRYRKQVDANESAVLDFSKPDDQFEVLYGNTMMTLPSGARIVIGNTDAEGVDGVSVYGDTSSGTLVPAGSNVITPTSVTASTSGNNIVLSPPFQFSLASLAGRFYVATTAASYLCAGGEINRYGGYTIQKTQPVSGVTAPLASATKALLLDGVASCQFGYSAIDSRHGQVSVSLQLQDSGEQITATRIINVENRP